MKRLAMCAALAIALVGVRRSEAAIIGASIPVGSQRDICRPVIDDVWSVSAPPYPNKPALTAQYRTKPLVL